MNLHEEHIEIGGISYRILRGENGTGTPVLFLHGWGSSAERYRQAFQSLPESFSEIVIPNLPGFGGSPTPVSVWGTKEYAAWVNSLIEKLAWQEFILAGHSFGGKITLYCAAKFPEKMRGIILYAAAGVTKRNPVKLTLLNKVAKTGKRLMTLPGLRAFYAPAEKILYRAIGNTDYLRAGERKEIFKKIIAEDYSELTKEIRVPTKLLWGSADNFTPLRDGQFLHDNISGSELKVIENATHLLHTQNPQLFATEFATLVDKLIAGK